MVQRLSREIGAALKLPDMIERLSQDGAVPGATTPKEFGDYIRREMARWCDVVRKANIRAE